jgi:hypothetical protein
MESLLLPGLRRHVMMRRCDFCDGKFGLIVETFQARRQFDALNLSGKITCVISVAAVLATASGTP